MMRATYSNGRDEILRGKLKNIPDMPVGLSNDSSPLYAQAVPGQRMSPNARARLQAWLAAAKEALPDAPQDWPMSPEPRASFETEHFAKIGVVEPLTAQFVQVEEGASGAFAVNQSDGSVLYYRKAIPREGSFLVKKV